jgi:hypothetical protein
MKKEIIVTLTRVFKKEVEITIPTELVKGMTDEEIQYYLQDEHDYDYIEEQFEHAESIDIPHDEAIYVDTDRFDIYEDGKQTYGGHL